MNIRAVIFDFDGPINDSFREGLLRIERICAENDVSFTHRERDRLTELWGIPGVKLLERGLGITSEQAVRMYKQWELVDFNDPVPLVPGARDVLRWLGKNGFTNCLLTSRNRQAIKDIFRRLDLRCEFSIIATQQDVKFVKPDPRSFDFVLGGLREQFGIGKDECIFIGDTSVDARAGRGAGIETLIVQTGPYLITEFMKHPIRIRNVLESVDNLPEWLAEAHTGDIAYDYR